MTGAECVQPSRFKTHWWGDRLGGELDRAVCPVACSFMLHMSRSRLASPTPILPQHDSLINCWVPQHLRALANKPSAVIACSLTQSNMHPKGFFLFCLNVPKYLRGYLRCSCRPLYIKGISLRKHRNTCTVEAKCHFCTKASITMSRQCQYIEYRAIQYILWYFQNIYSSMRAYSPKEKKWG